MIMMVAMLKTELDDNDDYDDDWSGVWWTAGS